MTLETILQGEGWDKGDHDAEKRLGGEASAQLEEARKLTFTSPVTDSQTKDKTLLALFKADKKDAAATAQKARLKKSGRKK